MPDPQFVHMKLSSSLVVLLIVVIGGMIGAVAFREMRVIRERARPQAVTPNVTPSKSETLKQMRREVADLLRTNPDLAQRFEQFQKGIAKDDPLFRNAQCDSRTLNLSEILSPKKKKLDLELALGHIKFSGTAAELEALTNLVNSKGVDLDVKCIALRLCSLFQAESVKAAALDQLIRIMGFPEDEPDIVAGFSVRDITGLQDVAIDMVLKINDPKAYDACKMFFVSTSDDLKRVFIIEEWKVRNRGFLTRLQAEMISQKQRDPSFPDYSRFFK